MNHKKIIPFINAENEYPANVIQLANRYSCEGADELFLYNYTGDEASREEFLSTVREIEKQIDIPFTVGILSLIHILMRKSSKKEIEEYVAYAKRNGNDSLIYLTKDGEKQQMIEAK